MCCCYHCRYGYYCASVLLLRRLSVYLEISVILFFRFYRLSSRMIFILLMINELIVVVVVANVVVFYYYLYVSLIANTNVSSVCCLSTTHGAAVGVAFTHSAVLMWRVQCHTEYYNHHCYYNKHHFIYFCNVQSDGRYRFHFSKCA